jgi:hypothetical protein
MKNFTYCRILMASSWALVATTLYLCWRDQFIAATCCVVCAMFFRLVAVETYIKGGRGDKELL